jgi:hypothetical protein
MIPLVDREKAEECPEVDEDHEYASAFPSDLTEQFN